MPTKREIVINGLIMLLSVGGLVWLATRLQPAPPMPIAASDSEYGVIIRNTQTDTATDIEYYVEFTFDSASE